MYYAGATNGIPAPLVSGQDNKGTAGIYIPGQGSYPPAAHMAPSFPGAQQVLPNGLTAATRYTPAPPQAYAVVSTPAGHPAYTQSLYSSMPYAGLSRLPTSAPTYIPATQYPAGISYQTAALAGRSAPHGQYSVPTPVQAGAPLFAAGYSPLQTSMAAHGARSLPMGPVATAAAYPPGYAFPAPAAATPPGEVNVPPIAYAHGGYVPQF